MKMRRFVEIVIGIIVVAMISFWVVLHSMKDYGIRNIHTYTDYLMYTQDMTVYVSDVSTDNILDERMVEKAKQYLSSTNGETSIFVIQAGTEYTVKSGAYIQDATVEQVLKGDKQLRGQKIRCMRSGGFVVYMDTSDTIYLYPGGMTNSMSPGDRYLLFCEEAEISCAYSMPIYRANLSPYSVLNLDRDDTTAIEEEDVTNSIIDNYNNKLQGAPYGKYADRECMLASDDALAAFLSVKHEIIEEYYDTDGSDEVKTNE